MNKNPTKQRIELKTSDTEKLSFKTMHPITTLNNGPKKKMTIIFGVIIMQNMLIFDFNKTNLLHLSMITLLNYKKIKVKQ